MRYNFICKREKDLITKQDSNESIMDEGLSFIGSKQLMVLRRFKMHLPKNSLKAVKILKYSNELLKVRFAVNKKVFLNITLRIQNQMGVFLFAPLNFACISSYSMLLL